MVKKEKKPHLYVHMSGDFSLELDGHRLTGRSRENSQFALLLQTILYHHKDGTDRNLLVRTLFGEQELDDVAHSLRNTMYLAKKKLKELGLPDVEYFRRDGDLYFWTDEIDVTIDMEEFEHLFFSASRAKNKEKRHAQMMEAARAYKGRFLPGADDGGVWIGAEAERLEGVFERCMWEIDHAASRMHCFDDLYEMGLHACRVAPYSNWEAIELKALVALDRFQEAETLCNETIERYAKKFGSRSTKQVHELEKALGQYMMYQLEDIDGIRGRLTSPEENARGGFVCEFPFFQELYRSVERVMTRFGGYIFLMLVTLVDKEGMPMENVEDMDELSELLLGAIVRSVRHSDTITRYGKGQYLVLLFGTKEENCSIVRNRIEADFAKVLEESPFKDLGADADYSISKVISEKPGSFPFFEQLAQGTGKA